MATYSFSLTPTAGGYPAAVTFTVSGLPTGAIATFAPSSIPANGTAQTVTLNIQTPSKVAINDGVLNHKVAPLVLAFLLLPLAMRRRLGKTKGGQNSFGSNLLILIAAGALGFGFTGCGGKGNSATQTPQNYTVVVTATSGAVQHSSTLTLIIQ